MSDTYVKINYITDLLVRRNTNFIRWTIIYLSYILIIYYTSSINLNRCIRHWMESIIFSNLQLFLCNCLADEVRVPPRESFGKMWRRFSWEQVQYFSNGFIVCGNVSNQFRFFIRIELFGSRNCGLRTEVFFSHSISNHYFYSPPQIVLPWWRT